MKLTPRQLLVLVLVACRDAGYSQVGRYRISEVFWAMRENACLLIPPITFSVSKERPFSRQLEEAFDTLYREGNRFDSITGTIEISPELSDAAIYKPLFEEQRQELDRYAGEFIQRLVTVHRTVAT